MILLLDVDAIVGAKLKMHRSRTRSAILEEQVSGNSLYDQVRRDGEFLMCFMLLCVFTPIGFNCRYIIYTPTPVYMSLDRYTERKVIPHEEADAQLALERRG